MLGARRARSQLGKLVTDKNHGRNSMDMVLTIGRRWVVFRMIDPSGFGEFWDLKGMHHRAHDDMDEWSTTLTRRERDVVRLAAEGLTAREIGAKLFIGVRTVETHIASAYLKLGIHSRFFLIRKARELGF